jgi:hypothetical protein
LRQCIFLVVALLPISETTIATMKFGTSALDLAPLRSPISCHMLGNRKEAMVQDDQKCPCHRCMRATLRRIRNSDILPNTEACTLDK